VWEVGSQEVSYTIKASHDDREDRRAWNDRDLNIPPPKRDRLPEMKELLELIAKALVDKPDEVAVSEVGGEQMIIFELRVAQDDLGKVIGKQGRTARAIRTIMSAAGTKLGKRFHFEIIEPSPRP